MCVRTSRAQGEEHQRVRTPISEEKGRRKTQASSTSLTSSPLYAAGGSRQKLRQAPEFNFTSIPNISNILYVLLKEEDRSLGKHRTPSSQLVPLFRKILCNLLGSVDVGRRHAPDPCTHCLLFSSVAVTRHEPRQPLSTKALWETLQAVGQRGAWA